MATILLGVAWLLVTPTSAAAHPNIERTEPEEGSVVDESPEAVRIYFSENVRVVEDDAVRVLDGSSRRVDRGVPRMVTPRTLETDLGSMSDGTYVVGWRVVGEDGHGLKGAFIFSVGKPGPSSGTSSAVAGLGELPGWLSAAGTAARSVSYVAGLLLLGPLVFLYAVWRPSVARVGLDTSDAEMTRMLGRLLPWAWAAVVGASVALLAIEAVAQTPGSVASALSPEGVLGALGTRVGRIWIVRAALLVALVPLALRFTPARPPRLGSSESTAARVRAGERGEIMIGSPDAAPGRAVATVVLAAAVVGAPAFSGHAATTSPRGATIASDFAHLLAVSTWMGGLACLVFLVPRALRAARGSPRARMLALVVRRFSTTALLAVTVLVAGGTYMSILQVGSLEVLFGSTYGKIVVAKIVVLAVVLLLGAYNLLRSRPRLAAAAGHPKDSKDSVVWATRLRRAAAGELALGIAAAVLAATLVVITPPRTEQFSGQTKLGPDELAVLVFPARVGRPASIRLALTAPDGKADAMIEYVKVALSLADQDIGPLNFPARREAPGRFVVEDVIIPVGGKWEMNVFVRRSDRIGFFGTISLAFEAIL